jgi:pimeloyl-ACP methyl ester carboxylesterase
VWPQPVSPVIDVHLGEGRSYVRIPVSPAPDLSAGAATPPRPAGGADINPWVRDGSTTWRSTEDHVEHARSTTFGGWQRLALPDGTSFRVEHEASATIAANHPEAAAVRAAASIEVRTPGGECIDVRTSGLFHRNRQLLQGRVTEDGIISYEPRSRACCRCRCRRCGQPCPCSATPANKHLAVSLTAEQFRYSFGNAIDVGESDSLYQRWTIPAPGRPLFEAAAANFSLHSPAKVNTTIDDRGPLLLVMGGQDHTVPEAITESTLKQYRHSHAINDLIEFPDRGHSLTIDHGWRDVASACLDWLDKRGL